MYMKNRIQWTTEKADGLIICEKPNTIARATGSGPNVCEKPNTICRHEGKWPNVVGNPDTTGAAALIAGPLQNVQQYLKETCSNVKGLEQISFLMHKKICNYLPFLSSNKL